MYRGTTPTITINCDIDVSEFVTMWVTFRTQQLASLSPDEDQQVEVQIRGRTEDGRAFASNIMTAPLSRILKDGVI